MGSVEARRETIDFLNGTIKTEGRNSRKKKKYADRPAGPASFNQILDYLNDVIRHGVTTNQLVNILGKDKEIMRLGYISEKRSSLSVNFYSTKTYVKQILPGFESGREVTLEALLISREKRE